MARLLELLMQLFVTLDVIVVFVLEVDPFGDVNIRGVEFERPFDVKLFNVASVAFNDKKLTTSLRESSLNKGNKPSDTASSMQGSSPLINVLESVFKGF